MTNYKILFLYLKKMNIHLDQKEFTFQLESHPEYPSLLAVSDTLSLFHIENAALRVHSSEIDSLPNYFITKLKDTQEDSLTYVEAQKTNHFYTIYQNSKKFTFTKEAFLKKWNGIVFLVEENTKLQKKLNQFNFLHLLGIACFVSFLFLVKQYFSVSQQFLFLLFPISGFFLSIIALQHLFNIDHSFADAFCNGSKTQQCASVITSKHWKILEKVNFSDLSIIFFSFQILLFFISGFTNSLNTFFEFQKILLFASIPVLMLSVYYQKFIVKKWCAICLAISGILISELIFITQFYQHSIQKISILDYNLSIFTLLITSLLWYYAKDKLTTINHLQTSEVKAIRFKKNYKLFKNTLISNPITVYPQTYLVFGNEDAKYTLDFVTNPYCGFCQAPYYMLKEILQRHEKDICLRFFFNYDLDKNDDKRSQLLQHLVYIHQEFGNESFFTALEDWYGTKDLQSWLQTHLHTYNSKHINQTIRNHRAYFVNQKMTFTPLLSINGYRFPEMYSLTDLTYFIEELLDDNTIQLAERRKAINRVDTII